MRGGVPFRTRAAQRTGEVGPRVVVVFFFVAVVFARGRSGVVAACPRGGVHQFGQHELHGAPAAPVLDHVQLVHHHARQLVDPILTHEPTQNTTSYKLAMRELK